MYVYVPVKEGLLGVKVIIPEVKLIDKLPPTGPEIIVIVFGSIRPSESVSLHTTQIGTFAVFIGTVVLSSFAIGEQLAELTVNVTALDSQPVVLSRAVTL